jgi:hypothetical protein
MLYLLIIGGVMEHSPPPRPCFGRRPAGVIPGDESGGSATTSLPRAGHTLAESFGPQN